MALPESRTELITFCKSLLGDDVLEINVSANQLEFCIDMAIRKFLEEHNEGSLKVYIPYKVDDADIAAKYIDVTNITGYERIINIERVFPLYSMYSASSIFSAEYQMALNDLFLLRKSAEITNYFLFRRNIEMMQEMLTSVTNIRFNRYDEKIYLDISWGRIRPDNYVIFESYMSLDTDETTGSPRLYSNEWLIKYSTALIKKQWGNNMKKFVGIDLPGGIKLDGQTIYNEAITEIKELEDELISKWSYPPMFISG